MHTFELKLNTPSDQSFKRSTVLWYNTAFCMYTLLCEKEHILCVSYIVIAVHLDLISNLVQAVIKYLIWAEQPLKWQRGFNHWKKETGSQQGQIRKKIFEHRVGAQLGLFALIYSGSWVCIKANRATLMKSNSTVEILSRLLIYTQSTQLKDPWLQFIKHVRVLELV